QARRLGDDAVRRSALEGVPAGASSAPPATGMPAAGCPEAGDPATGADPAASVERGAGGVDASAGAGAASAGAGAVGGGVGEPVTSSNEVDAPVAATPGVPGAPCGPGTGAWAIAWSGDQIC